MGLAVGLVQWNAARVQRPLRLHAAAETVALPQDRALTLRQSLLQMHEATDLDLGCRKPVANGRHPVHHLLPELAEAADGDAAGLARLYPAREGIGNIPFDQTALSARQPIGSVRQGVDGAPAQRCRRQSCDGLGQGELTEIIEVEQGCSHRTTIYRDTSDSTVAEGKDGFRACGRQRSSTKDSPA